MVNERGERDETLKIRRVLVAMDASPHSRAALEAAIELASHFEAELRGLFVEDINMLRAVGLPFSRVLGQFSASWRPIDAREIERRLRTRARQIQRLFRELTERSTLSTSFHVARGTVAREILAAAQEADVLVLGRVGWSQTREWRLGSTARVACTEAAPTMTLVIRQGQPLTTPVLVPYDGAPIGGLALRLGGMLVRGLHGPLQVLLLPTKEQDVQALREQVLARLARLRVKPQMRALREVTPARLIEAIQEAGCRSLILPMPLAGVTTQAAISLVEALDLPVLIVRQVKPADPTSAAVVSETEGGYHAP